MDFPCCNRFGCALGVSCRDRAFLCCYRVFTRVGFPCCDIAFYVATVGHSVMLQLSHGRGDSALGACMIDLDNAT